MQTVVDEVLGFIAETGYTAEEAIPGLMATVVALATETSDPSQALDEAVQFLEEVSE